MWLTPQLLKLYEAKTCQFLDAVVLGKCLAKSGAENLQSALREYQSIRLPVVSKQVLNARRMGCIKQGLVLPNCEPFDPKNTR